MRKLSSFNFITLNGFLNSPDGDISWHRHGEEENQYAVESMKAENVLLFGRKTYELMASYWPTPLALENDPTVAEGMNRSEKIVFSNTLSKAEWNNTTALGGDIVREMQQLKSLPGPDFTLLGSGSILSLFANHGLIDSFEILIDPVAIPTGDSIFKGIQDNFQLQLTDLKKLKSGVILLSYRPYNIN